MDNNNFFFNKSFGYCEDNENENNSLFFNNKEDNLLHSYNEDDEEYYNNNNINNNELLFTESFPNNNKFNLKLDNSFKLNNDNNIFQENNSLKDISSIGHTSNLKNDEDSNIINNSSSLNNISNNSSSTKEKSQLKNDNINNINNNIINDKKEDININDKDINKEILNKKRKQRIHLEDLGLDPEFIKDKKFETIGDKVFLSKNKILTEEDKKEIRAIRNRISAQKSRDKKKAEFSLFQKQIKYLNEILKQKNLIIDNYEKVCCPQCKAKFEEINKKIISEKIDIDINQDDNNDNSKEKELYLEEDENNSIIPNKNNSFLGKFPMLLIGIVCLIGISLCLFQYQNYNNKINVIPLRNLKVKNPTTINNINSITDKEKIDENVIILEEAYSPGQSNNDTNLKETEDNEFLQMCHDKFIFDVYSNHKKKKDLEEKQKTGFLVKKTYNKLDPNSFCFETNNINSGDYIINNNNNLTNTLPIQRDNIILNEYISNKIISVLIKDYESLKKYSDGKLLTLKEQIEKSAKNSEDGCIYLQLIMPKNEIGNDYNKENDTCPNNNEKYFEIRCKILSYFNYYGGDRI